MIKFLKSLLTRLPASSVPLLKVGDKLTDRVWGDSTMEITAISKDGKYARYKFLKINGKPNCNYPPTIYDLEIKYLLMNYELVKDESR